MSPVLGVIAAQAVKNFLSTATVYFISDSFGDISAAGTAYSINDGNTWLGASTLQNPFPTGKYVDIVYDNSSNRFTAITGNNKNGYSDDYSTIAAYSTNGTTWSTANMPQNFIAQAASVRSGYVVVAVGKYDQVARTTDGGATWVGSYSSGVGLSFRSIASHQDGQNYRFLAIEEGQYGARSSDNGASWSFVQLPNTGQQGYREVNSVNGYFIVTKQYDGNYAYSTNGNSWTTSNNGPSDGLTGVTYINGTYVWLTGGQGDAYGFYTATNIAGPWTYNSFNGMISGNSITAAQIRTIGTRAYIVGTGSWSGPAKRVLYSANGTSWTDQNLNIGAYYSAIAGKSDNTNTVMVSFGNASDPATGQATQSTLYFRSTDQQTWGGSSVTNSAPIPPSPPQGGPGPLVAWQYGNGRFVIKTQETNYLASTNGSSWVLGSGGQNTVTPGVSVNRFAFGAGKFVASSTYAYSDYLEYSTDGVNWNPAIASMNPQTFVSLTFGGDKFVRLVQDGRTEYSTNGINWTQGVQLTDPSGSGFRTIMYANNKFVAMTNRNQSNAVYVFSSLNGTTWSAGTQVSCGIYPDTGYGINNMFIVAGSDAAQGGTGIFYSADGLSWTTQWVTGTYNAYGITYGRSNYFLYYRGSNYSTQTTVNRSANLSSWSTVSTPFSTKWLMIMSDRQFSG